MATHNQEHNLDCSSYFSATGADDATIKEICDQYDFKNLTTLKYFVGAWWYNQNEANFTYRSDWMWDTSLTSDQYDLFYATVGSGSMKPFG